MPESTQPWYAWLLNMSSKDQTKSICLKRSSAAGIKLTQRQTKTLKKKYNFYEFLI